MEDKNNQNKDKDPTQTGATYRAVKEYDDLLEEVENRRIQAQKEESEKNILIVGLIITLILYLLIIFFPEILVTVIRSLGWPY